MLLAICAGLTGLGLVLSWPVMRKRGAASGLRAVAWSLIPIGAYLTGIAQSIWNLAVGAITMSPMIWAGVIVAGLSAVLFVVSGVMLGRRSRTAAAGGEKQPGPVAGRTEPKQVTAEKPGTADDLSDVEEILKRRGIS